jgi:DNA polymerase-3 subunit delta'
MSVWDSLVGQDKAIAQLKEVLAAPKDLAQSWLICGAPGSGRSNLALAFAAALECPNGGDGTCPQCKAVLAGTHPDVSVLSTTTVGIDIDSVRRLVATSEQMPQMGRWRILLITDVDRMAERTTNVLLKEVEEPAANTIWLLCAPSAQSVLPTIRSRCRVLTLAVPTNPQVSDFLLKKYGKGSGFEPPLTDSQAHQAARLAQGHIGLASLYATHHEMVTSRREILEKLLRLVRASDAVLLADDILKIADDQAQQSVEERARRRQQDFRRDNGLGADETMPPRLLAQYRQLDKKADLKREQTRATRDVLDRFLNDISSLYRDVGVVQAGAIDQAGLVNLSLRDQVVALSLRLSGREVIDRLDAVETARRRLNGNGSPQLVFEALLTALVPPFRPKN